LFFTNAKVELRLEQQSGYYNEENSTADNAIYEATATEAFKNKDDIMKSLFINLTEGIIYRWEDFFAEPLSESNLRNMIHEQRDLFRISKKKYPSTSEQLLLGPGEIYNYAGLTVLSKKGYIFVQDGKVRYKKRSEEHEILLEKNDFFKFSPGEYEVKIKGGCTLIMMWLFEEIPEIFKMVNEKKDL